MEQHTRHLQLVLNRLRQYKLYAKLSKCSFYQSSISFLGHHITSQGISPESDKIEAVIKWPSPRNKKEVQQFVGYANYYRRFVKSFKTFNFIVGFHSSWFTVSNCCFFTIL